MAVTADHANENPKKKSAESAVAAVIRVTLLLPLLLSGLRN
jgi:hypothetical protein